MAILTIQWPLKRLFVQDFLFSKISPMANGAGSIFILILVIVWVALQLQVQRVFLKGLLRGYYRQFREGLELADH